VPRRALIAVFAVALLAVPAVPPAFADDPHQVGSAHGGARAASHTRQVVLRRGDRGRAVRILQRRLRIAADGVFGRQTERAVKRFQRRRGLVVDGIVGPITRRALGLRPFRRRDVRRRSLRLPRILRLIAECESGGNPRAVSPSGRYRGKYQFLRSTWRGLGGRGDPARAPERTQDRLALKLYRREGVRPWGACGRAAKRRA
jgi:hypothetical protein